MLHVTVTWQVAGGLATTCTAELGPYLDQAAPLRGAGSGAPPRRALALGGPARRARAVPLPRADDQVGGIGQAVAEQLLSIEAALR